MSENEKKSKRRIYAEEGLLNAAFTLNGWFVKLKPAYAIDKMVFCFVKKNTKAAQSFNVYMDLDDFDIWMSDIENFRMKRIIDEEGKAKKTLPETYKIVTGEKGAFSVGICKSSNGDGYVINGHGKKKENGKYTGDFMNAFVPVSYDWLRVTARYYKLTVKKHYEELSDSIILPKVFRQIRLIHLKQLKTITKQTMHLLAKTKTVRQIRTIPLQINRRMIQNLLQNLHHQIKSYLKWPLIR